MAELTIGELGHAEAQRLYPFVMRNTGGADIVQITNYSGQKVASGGTALTERYVPRFYRSLNTNITVEVEAPNGEVHYFTVSEPPRLGAKENSVYCQKIARPANLEQLRTSGNVVIPDYLEKL